MDARDLTETELISTNDLIIAQDKYGFYFEINHDQLKITQGNKIIAQENIVDSNIRQKPKETTSIFEQELASKENSESSLTQVVWQLQEIRYNNDKLIEVDNPSNYTLEFILKKVVVSPSRLVPLLVQCALLNQFQISISKNFNQQQYSFFKMIIFILI